MAERLPVSLLTGFLGSGKTTLLGRLLGQAALGETAVIVNELGEAAIDHHLLRRVDERTVVLSSGCVCCTMRGDLADELTDLLERRARGEVPPFERVVVETTGLADPVPILQTLVGDPMLRHHVELDRVITTVDAMNGLAQLDREAESVRQAAVADRLVVTKTDLVARGDVERLVERLGALNPVAPIVEAVLGEVDAELLLRGGTRDAAEIPVETATTHGDVAAFVIELDEPVDWTAFGVWLTMLLQARGADILRVKGLIDVDGPGPVLVNGVQHVVHPPEHLRAWPEGGRRSRIVFIGRGIAPEAVEASLLAFSRAAA